MPKLNLLVVFNEQQRPVFIDGKFCSFENVPYRNQNVSWQRILIPYRNSHNSKVARNTKHIKAQCARIVFMNMAVYIASIQSQDSEILHEAEFSYMLIDLARWFHINNKLNGP